MPLRQIIVMLDAHVVDDSSTFLGTSTQRHILADLLRHDLVTTIRYADEGPPAGTPSPGPNCYEGWATVKDFDRKHGWSIVRPDATGSFVLSGVIGNGIAIAAQDVSAGAYQHLTADQASAQRTADALAEEIAVQALCADLFITEREYLVRRRGHRSDGTTLCDPMSAVAALGLYFRAQGQFPISRYESFNRGLFFWVGTRELLPEAWRWSAACGQCSKGGADPSIALLASAVLQRFDRALEIRDAVHVALNRTQDNDTRDAALTNLDSVLVFLMGAVDSAARVTHRVLGLSGSERYAGWQRKEWIAEVGKAFPTLAAVVAPGTSGDGVLTILRLLRNSVHGAALEGVSYYDSSRHPQTLVGVPDDDASEIEIAMNALGGPASWGATSIQPGRIHLDAGEFVDRLLVEIATVINDLMREVPVEMLPNVELSADDLIPPGQSDGPFAPRCRASIRALLGF